MCEHEIEPLTPLRVAARVLGVTEVWLRRECDAGRLPHLRAGRSVLVDLPLIRRKLLERAQSTPVGPDKPPPPGAAAADPAPDADHGAEDDDAESSPASTRRSDSNDG